MRISALCFYLGLSERTVQRWKKEGLRDRRKNSKKKVARKLSAEEEQEVYEALCSDECKEMNPHEAFNYLLDKGIYIASESTFYRILSKRGALAHRTEERISGESRHKPDELKAFAKNQVWMWDITWLKSPVTGIYYYAYVIEDLFDRSIVGWAIHEKESDIHSTELFESVCMRERAHPLFVHSDNGNPMKGITLVAFYYRLGIIPSFSRPRVSDDKPIIESFFKTLKYTCGYPKCFSGIGHAKKWFADFIHWYNYEHSHSGLQYVTPMQKRNGEHIIIYAKRNKTLEDARRKNPLRWNKGSIKKYVVRESEILNPDEKTA